MLSVVDVDAAMTTVTVLEEEFGMCEVSKAMARFGATPSSSSFLTLVLQDLFFPCITTRLSAQS